ncbi:MAG TPA: 50S ribosomal protein L13 [Pirellulaceae bacterium]|nr:50S ribosomal protein L13 [Pirellulaceae bacterium]
MAKAGDLTASWWLVDATDKKVGRLASDIAMVLMGKHLPTYTPHLDTGDFVVVVNCEKVAFTGKKWQQKEYAWFTGYTGQRTVTAEKQREHHPDRILRDAVRRMLPKNDSLARQMLSKLKIFAGPEHTHQAQQPQPKEMGAA